MAKVRVASVMFEEAPEDIDGAVDSVTITRTAAGRTFNARRIAGRPDIAVVKVTSDDRATLGAPRDDIHGWVTLTSHENGWRIYGFGAFPSLEQLPPPESESAPRYDNDFETTLE